MKHYLFCVFHGSGSGESDDAYDDFTQYTVSIADGETLDFGSWATQLVTAERCLTSEITPFRYVIALEHRADGTFDENTVAHLMMNDYRDYLDNISFSQVVVGYRDSSGFMDSFMALQVGRNRETGRVSKTAIGGAINLSDVKLPGGFPGANKALTLLPNTDLWSLWFPYYSQLLSDLPELDGLGRVSRVGVFQPLAPPVDDVLLCHASDYRARRRKQSRIPNSQKEFQLLISQATKNLFNGMILFRVRMMFFGQRWADGYIPNHYRAMLELQSACSVWFSLSVSLGIPQPEAPNGLTGYSSPEEGAALYPHTFDTIKLREPSEPILRILEVLRECYFEGFTSGFWTLFHNPGHDGPQYLFDRESALLTYENWESFTQFLTKIKNALLTLRVITMVEKALRFSSEPQLPRGIGNFSGTVSGDGIAVENLEIRHWHEMVFADRGEYLGTYQQPNVVVLKLPDLPPEQVEIPRKFDHTIHDDDKNPFLITWWEWVAIAITLIIIVWLIGKWIRPGRLPVREIPAERALLREAFARKRAGGYWKYKDVPEKVFDDWVGHRWANEFAYYLARQPLVLLS